jgi:hypothetical protein
MTTVDIRLDYEKPEISLNDSDIFLDGAPLVVLHYSCFQLYLSKVALRNLKQALRDGDGMVENYRQFMESQETLTLF